MNCPRCHGKGRVVQKAQFWRKGKKYTELDEIGICPLCHGVGKQHCCEGDQIENLEREQTMLNCCTDVNPNEA